MKKNKRTLQARKAASPHKGTMQLDMLMGKDDPQAALHEMMTKVSSTMTPKIRLNSQSILTPSQS